VDSSHAATGGVTEGSFSGPHLFKYLLLYGQQVLSVSKLESQLNTPGQETPMFAGLQLQWSLTVYYSVSQTVVHGPPVVRGGSVAVSEDKTLQNCIKQ
jgi:hypothetical protein